MKDFANKLRDLQLEATPGFDAGIQFCPGGCEIHRIDASRLLIASLLLRLSTLADQSLEAQLICGASIWQFFGANEGLVSIDIGPHRRDGAVQRIIGAGGLEEFCHL